MRVLSSTSLCDWLTVERFFLDTHQRDRLAGRQMTPLERVAIRFSAHVDCVGAGRVGAWPV
jgi:hypothetical protein